MKDRISTFLFYRLVFLFGGSVFLLLMIALLIKQGGSFVEVVIRAGPNVAPVVLAGLGLTGIIYTGAIDLSIASIIVVAGTVFGLLVYHGFTPLVCYAGCVKTAWGLSLF